MSKPEDSAFPAIRVTTESYEYDDSMGPMGGGVETRYRDVMTHLPGLTKREYFAGQALFAHLWLNRHLTAESHLAQNVARDAVACADALLAELSKEAE